ncbi:MAG: cation:proton antiporter [Woeseiaceae bacterium]|nr:cation:proton antiporter [Woeseiaceae bacterium]
MHIHPAIHSDPIAPVILGVTSILAFAVIGRVGARKLGQPTVLGELLMGILLGNIAWYLGFDLIAVLREGPRVFDVVHQVLAGRPIEVAAVDIFGPVKGPELARIISGPSGGEVISVAQAVDIFSRYGVIFMLFMVGLETNLAEIRSVGRDSMQVAVIGVVVPLLLGYVAVELIQPGMALDAVMFVAATLVATSIGITSAVLREANHAQTREGRIILGAAVGDDILGLLILAIVSGIVVTGSVDVAQIVKVSMLSLAFLVVTFRLGPYVLKSASTIMRRLDIIEAKMFTSYLFVMVLAWTANLVGLATIIGAFAAGIVMHDGYFREHAESKQERVFSVRELIAPLEVILVPIFFILIGMQVKLESFVSWPVIILAAGLLVAAVLGKLASGLGARGPVDRLTIGLGMLPRGEVGLVFAAIGQSLGVIGDSTFAAIVLMVFVTTLVAPPLLKLRISRQRPAA